MASVVDTLPFPWHLPEAQELHTALCDIYPTPKGAIFVAVQAGLKESKLLADQPSYLLWKDILNAGAAAKKNGTIVKTVLDQNPTTPQHSFLSALLVPQAAPITLDRQPRGADGAPLFLKDSDKVTEPEALLFHDDLTLPIGRVRWLIAVLQRIEEMGPAVCRLQVGSPGVSQRGTGFRIAPDILLTNWHVLHFKDVRAAKVTAEFGYDDDGKGGGLASTAVPCDVATIRGNADDDWAIITVAEKIVDTIPIIKLSEAVDPEDNAPAFIVQHPGGERKRIAYVRNQVTSFDERVVHYLSDTQPGSSGSPVLNEDGRLFALHRAGGRPQEVAGKPPLRKNEGIRIPRIRDGLANLGVVVP